MRRLTLACCTLMIVVLSGCARTAAEAAPGEPPPPDDRTPTAETAPGEQPVPVGRKPGVEDCPTPPRPPVLSYVGEVSMYTESEAMLKALNRIQQAGESTFRDVFAGLETVQDKGYAIVYRVPSPKFDAFIRESAGDECVLVQDVAFSNARLRVLQDRIVADVEFWRKRGIAINLISASYDGSGVVVGTLDVAKAEVELPRHYATEIPIIVRTQSPMVPAGPLGGG